MNSSLEIFPFNSASCGGSGKWNSVEHVESTPFLIPLLPFSPRHNELPETDALTRRGALWKGLDARLWKASRLWKRTIQTKCFALVHEYVGVGRRANKGAKVVLITDTWIASGDVEKMHKNASRVSHRMHWKSFPSLHPFRVMRKAGRGGRAAELL